MKLLAFLTSFVFLHSTYNPLIYLLICILFCFFPLGWMFHEIALFTVVVPTFKQGLAHGRSSVNICWIKECEMDGVQLLDCTYNQKWQPQGSGSFPNSAGSCSCPSSLHSLTWVCTYSCAPRRAETYLSPKHISLKNLFLPEPFRCITSLGSIL